jgi:DNA polymerase-3 subunit beta
MLAELPEQEIVMELGDNNVINIACGRIQSKLFSMAPDEFPPMRSFEGVEPLTLPQGMLRNLLSKTSFAICSDQARYNLTGLLFQLQGGALTVVATDGRRMTLYMKSGGVPETSDVKVIIPGKMIHELERLLADSDEEVKVYLDETQAAFEFNSIRLVTALIEGNFPNYEMVVPKKHDKEGQVERGPFVEAIRRTRTMTNDKFNSVRFQIGTGNMILKVVTPEVGEYVEEMPIEYEGETVEIAFNPDFMLDVLRHIESDKVLLQFRDGTSPGVLKPAGEDETDQYVNVIMPIRI